MRGPVRLLWSGVVALLCLQGSCRAADVSLSLPASEYDNVFYADEAKSLDAIVGNSSSAEVSVQVLCTVSTDQEKQVELKQALKVPGKQTVVARFAPEIAEPGYADVKVQILGEEGKALAEKATSLAVVRRPSLAKVSFPEAFYGFSFFQKPRTSARIGGRFIRTMIHWKFSNPEPGKVSIGEFTNLGREAESCGMGMIYTFAVHLRPDWLSAADPAQLKTEAVLKRYEEWISSCLRLLPEGSRAIEISNEPDLEMMRSKAISFDEKAAVSGELLGRGYALVKAFDSTIPVLGAGVSGVDIQNQFAFSRRLLAEAGRRVDYFSPHPYTDSRYLGGTQSVTWPDSYTLTKDFQAAVDVARKYTVGKAVWSTELGWAIPGAVKSLDLTSRDVAAITSQALVLSKTVPGVEKLAYFAGQLSWLERGMNYSLFLPNDKGWRPLPAVCAYATVTSLLEGSETGSSMSLGPAVRGYRFDNKRTGRTVFALWASRHEVVMKDALPDGGDEVDLFGREHPLAGAVSLTRAPVYITVPLEQGKDYERALAGAKWRPRELFAVAGTYAPRPGVLASRIENFLPEPVPAVVSICGKSRKVTLSPGLNAVEIELAEGEWTSPRMNVAVSVESPEGNFSGQEQKHLLLAPYVEAISVDGGVSETKRKLLAHSLESRDDIRPPDPAIAWDGPSDLSAKYGYAWNEQGLYIIVAATDDVQTALPAEAAENFWDYDSLQLGISAGADGHASYSSADREMGLALADSGASVLLQTHPPKSDPLAFPNRITRSGHETVYEILLPWKYLVPDGPVQAGSVFAVNFILNDNDGGGRKYWLGPAEGIASGKRPDVFPWLRLAPKKEN